LAAVGIHRSAASRPAEARTTNSIVTAADVLQAHHSGKQLRISSPAVVTPLARELAMKHGVSLVPADAR
jgi:hypothetical protein